jgi:hypothetical protein
LNFHYCGTIREGILDITIELSTKETFDRQLEGLWDNGFGSELLRKLQPRIDRLAKDHYLQIANSGTAGTRDSRLGIETGAMFRDLTQSVIQDRTIILDTLLDYALEQEQRLAESGRSFLPSEAEVFAELSKLIEELF